MRTALERAARGCERVRNRAEEPRGRCAARKNSGRGVSHDTSRPELSQGKLRKGSSGLLLRAGFRLLREFLNLLLGLLQKCLGLLFRLIHQGVAGRFGRDLRQRPLLGRGIDELLPLSTVITPNIPEGEILSGEKIESKDDMERAAKRIGDTYGCAVLLKGGHRVNDANDLLYAGGEMQWFEGKRIDNPNTHGTGCTLSSAIASNLAKGYSLSESVARAKEYISGALSAMLDLGKGAGPMQHNFDLRGEFAKENTK